MESKRDKVDTAFREGHLLYRVMEASGGLSGLSSQILSTVGDPMSLIYGQSQSWKSAFVILRYYSNSPLALNSVIETCSLEVVSYMCLIFLKKIMCLVL